MSILHVMTREGERKSVAGQEGISIMEMLRNNDVDENFALCGGCCSCATCHVYVEEDRFAALPAMGEDENELLDGADGRQGNSRLSCQIPWSDDLDGLRIILAPAE